MSGCREPRAAPAFCYSGGAGYRAREVSYRISASTVVRFLELRVVVGMLPGHDPQRAQEFVVFSGHYDHLGIVKPFGYRRLHCQRSR